MHFTAIDFETATNQFYSACAVGIVTVRNSVIVDEYYTLIQPPNNEYAYHNIRVHGIEPHHTAQKPNFEQLYATIKSKLQGELLVAHNEQFDRNVLAKTMAYYGLDYQELKLAERWECTCRIYRAKGYKPANLSYCSAQHNIALQHHEALSDARACAQLYMLK
jgi:DNA polymerase III subunit epsilon